MGVHMVAVLLDSIVNSGVSLIEKSFAIGIQYFVSEHKCPYCVALIIKVPLNVAFPKIP